MTTTIDELMELAEYYAGETASDLKFGDGDPDGCRAALRTAVESLVADRDVLRSIVDASTHNATGWYYRAVNYMQTNAKDWT